MTFKINVSGSFDKTDGFLAGLSKGEIFNQLEVLAQRGVAALAAATPVDSGASADSWGYEVDKGTFGNYKIYWTNSHLDDQGTPIVILLEHGHGTGTGGYVQGRDFINPAIEPIFDEISAAVWNAVTAS